jgi:hypothetical protein
MTRTTLRIVGAAALSFALTLGGHWIARTFVVPRGGSEEDNFVAVSLIELLLVLPLVSIFIGALIGWFEERDRWWLAAVSLAPLLAYGLFDSFAGPLLFLCLIYLILACASALLTASMKGRWRRGVLKSG